MKRNLAIFYLEMIICQMESYVNVNYNQINLYIEFFKEDTNISLPVINDYIDSDDLYYEVHKELGKLKPTHPEFIAYLEAIEYKKGYNLNIKD